MSFSSFEYVLGFLPLVLLVCHFLRKARLPKAPQIWILMASLFFYAWPRPENLVYLICSILANWYLARWIARAKQPQRKVRLQTGLFLNLAFLGVFKYTNFFLRNISFFMERGVHAPALRFPLGISFFTLTQVMYLVDCYEELNPPHSLLDHASFVSFFPYVISGPISRAKRILHQFPVLNGESEIDASQIARGIFLFSLGLAKKVILADAFAKIADSGFSNYAGLSAMEAWIAVTAYALQLYFDFCGYSDMAIASALFLGIEIPRNFDSPMRATSIIEFWQRWHISLSAFITTYLYTPILRSFKRATLATAAASTLLAMAIAGLWHGANWTFVVFGAIHGLALAANQYWRKKRILALPKFLSWLLTLAVIDLAFVFFRSPDLQTAQQFMTRMVDWHNIFSTAVLSRADGTGPMAAVFFLAQIGGTVGAFVGPSTDQWSREFQPTWLGFAGAASCTLAALLYLNSNVTKPFVYFQF